MPGWIRDQPPSPIDDPGLPDLAGDTGECPWDWFFYANDDVRVVAIRIQSLKKFPPRQKPNSFNLDAVLEKWKMSAAAECAKS